MLYVCVRGVMDVVFSVCIGMPGAMLMYGNYECLFHHADGVCLCPVCILCQFSMLYSACLLMPVSDSTNSSSLSGMCVFIIMFVFFL